MKFEAARYELPLTRPLQLGSERVLVRAGWLVRRGTAVGDACPLPEFSSDTLGEVDSAIASGKMTASLEWALSTLQAGGPATVRTAGLLVALDEQVAPTHACIKLKVGRRPIGEELDAIARCRAVGLRLRLDGNRSLALDVARRLADAAADALEFFEEPVAPSDLELAMRCLPIALDETLGEPGEVPSGAAAFVLKPTVLGLRRTLELVEVAQRTAIPIVVSSAYESAVGRAALIRFAAAVAPDVAHGLGTGPAFVADFAGWVQAAGDRLTAGEGELPAELEWVGC
ncbi:MAG: hypothetical protein NXI31_08775 [bacterium]|nr:hypothetical protein [bacterium]